MPKSEVAHFVEAARQHVLEEPAHELLAAEATGAPAVGLAVAILDADGGVIEAGDARVGDGDAEDVTGEIIEHCLLAATPGGDVGDPALAPDHVGRDEIGTGTLQKHPELAAHLAGKRFDRE